MIPVYMIVEFLASFTETFFCCIFCRSFINTEDSKSTDHGTLFLLSVLGAVIATILNHIELFSYASTVVAIFILVIIQVMIFRKQFGFIFVLVTIYLMIISAIDFLVAQIASFILGSDVQLLLSQHSIGRIGCTIISKTMLILFVDIVSKLHKIKGTLSRRYMLGICLLAFFVLSTNFALIKMDPDIGGSTLQLLTVLYFILTAVLVFGVFYMILVISENYEQKQNVALLELQNEMMIKSQKDSEQLFMLWRKSFHDYKNHIIAIRQMVENEDKEEVISYLDQQYTLMNAKLFCVKTGNSVVDALINTKQNLAENKGITFVVNAVIPDRCYISNMDFATMLGNLIDNAIESTEKEENPYIELIIKSEGKLLIVKISNTFSGELAAEMVSTKTDKIHHGIGTQSVQSIVEKYNGKYEMVKKEEQVIVTIMLLNVMLKM